MFAAKHWILYVEDNEDDYEVVREVLPEVSFTITWAPNVIEARHHLASMRFDLMLLDYALPDANGLLFLEEIRARYNHMPVIFLSGRNDEALAVSAVKKGAIRYLLKDEVKAPSALRAAVEEAIAARDAERAGLGKISPIAAATRESQHAGHLYRVLLSTMNEGCLLIDMEGIITFANEAAGQMLGRNSNDLTGRRASEFVDKPTARRLLNFRRSLISGSPAPRTDAFEGFLQVSKTEPASPVLISARSVHNELGKYEACIVVLADISKLAWIKGRYISIIANKLQALAAAVQKDMARILDGAYGELEENQQGILNKAQKHIERMAYLTENILDASRTSNRGGQ